MNLSNWSSDICSLCCPVTEFCGISTGKKEFTVDFLHPDIGIVVVLPIRSSPFATGWPCTNLHWNCTCGTWCRKLMKSSIRYLWWLKCRTWICKHVSLWFRQIPCIKWQAFVAPQQRSRTWNDCWLTGNVSKFSTVIRFYILKFSGIIHAIHLLLQLMYLWSESLFNPSILWIPLIWVSRSAFPFMTNFSCSCKRWDLCWSATLPWTLAGKMWVESHRGPVFERDRWKDRRSGWNGWERTCACSQCQVQQGMRRDTWMTIVLRTQRCAILNLELRVMKCDYGVQLCTCCICGCTVHSPRRLAGGFLSRQPKPVLTLWKNHQSSGLEECWEFQLLVFHWVWSHVDDDDEAVCSAGWPAILTKLSASLTATVCRTSNLFSGQLRSRVLRCPQIVVRFAVLPVDCEEWFFFLLGSLAGARHAIVCSLFFAWAKSGRWLSGCWVSNVSNSEFFQLLWRRRCVSPGRSCRTILCGVLSTRCHTITFCILQWRTIVKVSLDGLRAFPVGSF